MKFTYISEILQDKRFKSILNDMIEEETHRRNNRLVVFESKGLELRRNTFIRLDEQGLMTVDWLTAQFELIANRTSELSANERHLIWSMVDEAIVKTVEYYQRSGIFNKTVNYFAKMFG